MRNDLQPNYITKKPLNAETPLEVLCESTTPTDLFYVRNHFPIPEIDTETWRLQVRGAVNAPLALSLDEIRHLPAETVRVTMECAGNGRSSLDPKPPGVTWGLGAISTGTFTGPSLSTVLERAGIRNDAVEVMFRGADRGKAESGEEVHYARSLPLDVALHPDTRLIWQMNGQPLPRKHGFPLRLLVPRWYAMASVKWLDEIVLLTEPFTGFYQHSHYVYQGEEGVEDGTPVRHVRVRALFSQPTDGDRLRGPDIDVTGVAYSGSHPIARVEVQVDDGAWQPAELIPAESPYAASHWRFAWRPAGSGEHTLRVRATDAGGNTQPLTPRWNALGYGNNCVQSIVVHVV
jgi:DMSO/TMAO reductase YedYZ molybdopterin-dependent catalytic subunit